MTVSGRKPLAIGTAVVLVLALAPAGLSPFLVQFLINLFMLLRDPWRRGRSRRERIGLTVLVLGSPVAWFIANLISDAYHLLR